MINFSENKKAAFLSSNQKYITLEFSNGVTLTNDHIYSESLSLDQILCDESTLMFGKCNASVFKIKIISTDVALKGSTLTVTISCNYNNETYSHQLGVYVVDSETKSSDKRYKNIVAYDFMHILANTDCASWYDALEFPITVKNLRDSLFSHLNIQQETITLINDSVSVKKTVNPESLSALTLLEYICELNVCFGTFNNTGVFKYIKLAETTETQGVYPSTTLYPSDSLFPGEASGSSMLNVDEDIYYQGSLTFEEFYVKNITQVQFRENENDVGAVVGADPTNPYVVENNILLYGMTNSELTAVASTFFNNCKFISYTPLSVELKCRPWVELGDYISIYVGSNTIMAPVLVRSISGITAIKDTYEAGGENYFTEKVNGLNYDIKQLLGKSNSLSRTVEATVSQVTDLSEDMDSKFTQTAADISLKVSKSSIISEINQSAETIKISASKVNISGFVRFSDLRESGESTINGDNITTGTISGRTIIGGIYKSFDESKVAYGLQISEGVISGGLFVGGTGISNPTIVEYSNIQFNQKVTSEGTTYNGIGISGGVITLSSSILAVGTSKTSTTYTNGFSGTLTAQYVYDVLYNSWTDVFLTSASWDNYTINGVYNVVANLSFSTLSGTFLTSITSKTYKEVIKTTNGIVTAM